MMDEQLRHILHLQRHGYTDIRHHETHKWCGRQGDYACFGIQDDGSCMSRNPFTNGLAAVAYLEKMCAPEPTVVMSVFGNWWVQ